MTAIDSRTGDPVAPSVVRALIRRIVDGVAVGQKYHLKVVFSDRTTHDTTRLGDPDITIIFRNRRARVFDAQRINSSTEHDWSGIGNRAGS